MAKKIDWDKVVDTQGDQLEGDYNSSSTTERTLNSDGSNRNGILYMVRQFTTFYISIYFMRISYKLTTQIKPRHPYTKNYCIPKSAHQKGYLRHNHVPNQRAGFAFQKKHLVTISPRRFILFLY